MRLLLRALFLLALLCLTPAAWAQTLPAPPLPSPTFAGFVPSRAAVLTVGPGEEVYELFGHNVLIFFDIEGRAVAYNWGVYNFAEPGFVGRFVMGRMRYQMQPANVDRLIDAYASQHRAITLQLLTLTPQQVAAAWNWCQEQDTDATRTYTYDYFTDNCSTRVRDAINVATAGRLRDDLSAKVTGATIRWHTLRLSRPLPWMLVSMTFALGHPTDAPISEYEAAFVPMELAKSMAKIRWDGHPLVASERSINPDVRIIETPAPQGRGWTLAWLAAGAAWGGVMLLTLLRAWWWRWLGMAGLVGWVLLVTAAGLVGSFLAFVTDHVASRPNENLLQLSPLALVTLIALVAGRRGRRWAGWAAAAVLGLAVVGAVAKILPTFNQPNWAIIALALPAHFAAAAVLLNRARKAVR